MSKKADKPGQGSESTRPRESRPEARLPKGLQDSSAQEIRATEAMLATIRSVFELYGFEPLSTPALEYTDALGKFLPDQDRPNAGVFSFQDDDDQWLSLRYDLTAPLARYVAENSQRRPKPFRRYQTGLVWRNEKPGPGRFRQFMQFDADTVGAPSVAADAELCLLAAATMEALGVPRGDYVVKFNSRKILDGVLEAIGVEENRRGPDRIDPEDEPHRPVGGRRVPQHAFGYAHGGGEDLRRACSIRGSPGIPGRIHHPQCWGREIYGWDGHSYPPPGCRRSGHVCGQGRRGRLCPRG